MRQAQWNMIFLFVAFTKSTCSPRSEVLHGPEVRYVGVLVYLLPDALLSSLMSPSMSGR